MENLMTMLKYLLLQQTLINTETKFGIFEYVTSLDRYAEFLTRKLELWMLIPCDTFDFPMDAPTKDNSAEYIERYNAAVERTYFQHVYLDPENEVIEGDFYLPLEEIENMTINDLANIQNVGLTPKIQQYLTEL